MKEKEYIYYRESAIQSIISDSFSFGMLIFFIAVNKYMLGDHVSLAILMFFLWMFMLAGKATGKSKRFTDKNKLKEYINNL